MVKPKSNLWMCNLWMRPSSSPFTFRDKTEETFLEIEMDAIIHLISSISFDVMCCNRNLISYKNSIPKSGVSSHIKSSLFSFKTDWMWRRVKNCWIFWKVTERVLYHLLKFLETSIPTRTITICERKINKKSSDKMAHYFSADFPSLIRRRAINLNF